MEGDAMHDHNHGHWFPIGALLGVALCLMLNGLGSLWKMVIASGASISDLSLFSLATIVVSVGVLGVCWWKKQD